MLRNSLLTLAAGLLLAPLAWADEPKPTPTPAKDRNMKGSWVAVEGTNAGQEMPDNHLSSTRLLLNEGKYTVVVGEDKEEGNYQIDMTKSPAPVDIEPTMGVNKGKLIRGIVEINGDTMKVCYNMSGPERPKEFKSTAENKFIVISYKREKEKK